MMDPVDPDPLDEPIFPDVMGLFVRLANLSLPEDVQEGGDPECRAEESNLATPKGPELQSSVRPSAHGGPTSG